MKLDEALRRYTLGAINRSVEPPIEVLKVQTHKDEEPPKPAYLVFTHVMPPDLSHGLCEAATPEDVQAFLDREDNAVPTHRLDPHAWEEFVPDGS